MKPQKVLVCGAAEWDDRETIHAWLSSLPRGSTIIRPARLGASLIAGEVAADLRLTVRKYPNLEKVEHGDWNANLNQLILDEEHRRAQLGTALLSVVIGEPIDRVFAFTWALSTPAGAPTDTGDLVTRAVRAGITSILITPGSRP